MEARKKRALVVMVVVLGLLVGQSAASFKDCYAKCFIFCMIEPSQTLCSCSTHCLKDCIFPESQNDLREDQKDNVNFCKLGCAVSICSSISSKGKPNGDKMDDCVGSCSKTCTKSWSLP
ncbi:thionin-like protein 2 [Coffea eugenioides]|uniref:Thionin-like protein 2 n=1 Tax=Coffea arabica TaxID=13443 RepID=A0A6P6XDT6_COFAR|nr:thionin-like protein 2 [Coffea arabica]XP_027168578.1 thionin-like protein 2 [Coffea eugenioides]